MDPKEQKYLSGIALKWTPNQLMNGNTIEDKSVSWQYALNLELRSVQFIHCHQVKKVIQFDLIMPIALEN